MPIATSRPRSASFARLALVAAIVTLISACSDATSAGGAHSIQAHLQRVAPGGATASGALLPSRDYSAPNNPVITGGSSAQWTSDVSITSLRAPIFTIRLVASSGRSVSLYDCAAGTNDGCLVELNGGALQDLISSHPVSAAVGTYDQVVVETCRSNGYTSYITASAVIGGTTYHTTTTGALSTTGPAQATPLAYSGCARKYSLPTPVTVADTAAATIPFTLYFDIRDIAWAAVNGSNAAWLPSGCSARNADGTVPSSYVCVGYPDVAGIAGATPPVLERYRINGGATLGIFFTAGSDEPIGGFTRRYYAEGVTADAGFSADTPVDTLRKNADGSLYITTFGGSVSGGSGIGAPYFAAAAFRRSDHSGSFTSQGQAGTYAAVRIP